MRAWGHPVGVRGDVTLDGRRANLRAIDIPPGQFVELRALIPRRVFTSTDGMKVVTGPGLERIVAEERDDAAAYERDKRKIDDALHNLPRTLAILLALALGPALALIAFVWWRFGRERKTAYDREYEQEPPTETQPALVPSLLAQGGTPGSLEFTATLFDLIRRGRYRSEPVTTERKIWGGLKTQQVADLELSLGDVEAPVEAFEAPVAQVVDAILAEGPERLSLFRDRIEEDRKGNSERFTAFKSAVGTEISGRKWFSNTGLVALLAGAGVLAVAGGLTLLGGISSFNSVAPSWRSVVAIALGACGLVGAAALVIAAFNRPLWRRRTPGRAGGGRALGGVPPLPDRLPAARHRPAGDARALGALPRLRDRVRDRRARPPGRAAAHARGARAGEHALLDRPVRRPRLGPDLDEHRRPRVRVRLRARAAVVRVGRIRRRLLGRRRRRRRRWRRRRLVRLAAVALAGRGRVRLRRGRSEAGGRRPRPPCSPGEHVLRLANGQAARMRVTPPGPA